MTRLIILTWVIVAILSKSAPAIVVTHEDGASIRLPGASAPAALRNSDFTLFVWLWADDQPDPSAQRAVFQVAGLLDLSFRPDQGMFARVTSGSASLSVQAIGVIPAHEWVLVEVTYRRSTGFLGVYARSQSGPALSGSGTLAALANQPLGPITGDIALGATASGLPAMHGAYGLVAIRDLLGSPLDAPLLFETRRYFGPYDGRVRTGGGTVNGAGRCQWMLNHAMTTKPEDYGAGGTLPQRAAVVGGEVGPHNIHVFDRAVPVPTQPDEFRIVRPATVTGSWTYASHRDPPYDGFFRTDAEPFTGSTGPVARESRLARQLSTGPRRQIRVMVSSNSRGVRTDDGSGTSPGNYVQGFWDLNRGNTAGVFFRPATRERSRPWFGLDATAGAYVSGTLLEIGDETSAFRDFGRFWTGTTNNFAAGPGAGVFMAPGASYSLLCRGEPGSRLLADAPLATETFVMRYPGSSELRWRTNRAASQGAVGSLGDEQTVSLDTTRSVITLTSEDGPFFGSSFILDGDQGDKVRAGDACFVAGAPGSGGAHGAISVVSSVQVGFHSTTITLLKPFAVPIQAGDVLRFGSWSIARIDELMGAAAPGDPNQWRGLLLTTGNQGSGVMVFAHSAYRPDETGFVWGSSGWGGNGYSIQIIYTFPDAMSNWMAMSAADVWLQVPAQQTSTTTSMTTFAAFIRGALPDVDLVWANEGAHPIHTYDNWATYVVEHAAESDAVGVVALPDTRVGTGNEQYADGQRSDQSHISARGNLVLARVWTDLIGQAALDPCPCDWNMDGGLDSQDFFEFLESYFAGEANINAASGTDSQDYFDFLECFFSGCG